MWPGPLLTPAPGGIPQPRVGIAGIAIESSTFSPHRSGIDAFTIRRGDELRGYHPFLAPGTDLGDAARWVPLMHARALPGGAVPEGDYVAMKHEIVDRIEGAIAEGGPFDGFLLDIHGAMSVVGRDDAEADLARAVRLALGPDTLISASMDLHGNVSRALLDEVDLITCYRMAPHEDELNSRARALHNLLLRLRGPHGRDPLARRPLLAWQQIPVLLPGEKTSTRLEPARGIYRQVAELAAADGVLDAAVWVGYAWADEPRCRAAVVVSGDDATAITDAATRLARRYWQARDEFGFVAPAAPLAACLERAMDRGRDLPRPFVISDTGDNPTAGGAGDVSWTLAQLLIHPAITSGRLEVAHASVFDADAVKACAAAGVGAEVDLAVGGRVDPGPHGPVRLRGTVETVVAGDPVAGTQAVVRAGGLRAVITQRRKPFHHVADFTDLGIDPHALDVLVVKIGYLEPELHALAADWMLALTPGGVDQDLLRLGHHRLGPGVHPFDPDAAWAPAVTLTRRGGV